MLDHVCLHGGWELAVEALPRGHGAPRHGRGHGGGGGGGGHGRDGGGGRAAVTGPPRRRHAHRDLPATHRLIHVAVDLTQCPACKPAARIVTDEAVSFLQSGLNQELMGPKMNNNCH